MLRTILRNINVNCEQTSEQYFGLKFYSNRSQQRANLRKLYQILGVAEDCEDEVLRIAFVNLVKKYHPDSGNPNANAYKFSEIESAYRQIQKSRCEAKEKAHQEEVQEHDIEHTAPQHRHYLQYDVGIGNPSMRQRRYAMERAQKAVENVMEHRLSKLQAAERSTLVGMDKKKAKDIKTRFGADRLVEDLIQEAMSKGEFSNLPGTGIPLKKDITLENPYVDFITHKLNQIMIDNGFTPEWIQLSKEIREEIDEIKLELRNVRNNLGEELSLEDSHFWENAIEKLKHKEKSINKKIDKYNLLVPILQKQRLRINLDQFAQEALSLPPVKPTKMKSSNSSSSVNNVNNDTNNIVGFLSQIFSNKKS